MDFEKLYEKNLEAMKDVAAAASSSTFWNVALGAFGAMVLMGAGANIALRSDEQKFRQGLEARRMNRSFLPEGGK